MANQYTAHDQKSLCQKVYEYVLENCAQTTREIAAGSGLAYSTVSRSLTRLRQQGLIKKEIRGLTSACHWMALDEDETPRFEGTICTWRKTWPPVQLPPQGIFAALGL